jgi:hypothetical protein
MNANRGDEMDEIGSLERSGGGEDGNQATDVFGEVENEEVGPLAGEVSPVLA